MKVKIKRIEKDIVLPEYQTEGSVAFDLMARTDVTVKSKEIALIPSNTVIETPPGYALVLAPRSSTPKKTGLSFPHSIGIIDQDYSGPDDEILIQVYNFTDNDVEIKKGQRIAQGMFLKMEIAEWEEVESMEHNKTRGGLGSTGA